MAQRELYHPPDSSLHLLNQPESVDCPKCSISALRFATSNVRHAARLKKRRKEKRSTAQQSKAQLMQENSYLIKKKRYLRNNTDCEMLHVLIGTLKGRERVKRNIAQSVPRDANLPGHSFVAPWNPKRPHHRSATFIGGSRIRRSPSHSPSLITSPLLS